MIKNINIIGSIDSAMVDIVLSSLLEEESWENISELHLYINSDGGYLTDCFAIIDLITEYQKRYNLKVVTKAYGKAHSCGFYLLLLGDERYISENTEIFVHLHSVEIEGAINFEDYKNGYKQEKKIYKKYINFCSKKLNLAENKVHALLKKDDFLTSLDLINYNIIKVNDG